MNARLTCIGMIRGIYFLLVLVVCRVSRVTTKPIVSVLHLKEGEISFGRNPTCTVYESSSLSCASHRLCSVLDSTKAKEMISREHAKLVKSTTQRGVYIGAKFMRISSRGLEDHRQGQHEWHICKYAPRL